ncbi:MAG: XRE family transcriptional regulator [Saprospiraceae bacterium]|uniref:XRE family transcriptional regulator n=1 Tax=Candidatus Opimibacter skivensis TaxID=2982028 RepID=A0A9D7XTB6_9BACT|nr:XRE family transcriptional regulator [Candidatus Opimibacter skivensis]
MSTETLGERLRNLRLEKKMPLRKVAALIDVDVAILSKMERGERKITRPVVEKLASIYQHDPDELMVLFLSERVLYELENESLALPALRAAEEQVQYKLRQPREDKDDEKKRIVQKMQTYFQSQHLVTKAWIFGSFARGDDTPQSDIDVMIDVPSEQKFNLFDLAEVQHQIEQRTNKKVDVVMLKGIRPEMEKRITQDKILIYEA